MKMLLTAVAMMIATPALAQTAAPADPHAGHHAPADPHAGHDMKGGCCEKDADGKMKCCEKMAAAGKEMECCEKMRGKTSSADSHAGHKMNPKN